MVDVSNYFLSPFRAGVFFVSTLLHLVADFGDLGIDIGD